jgi:hypothetical protein
MAPSSCDARAQLLKSSRTIKKLLRLSLSERSSKFLKEQTNEVRTNPREHAPLIKRLDI